MTGTAVLADDMDKLARPLVVGFRGAPVGSRSQRRNEGRPDQDDNVGNEGGNFMLLSSGKVVANRMAVRPI